MMKIVYRILAVALLALVPAAAHAEFRWGVTAGANFTTYHMKQKLVEVNYGVGGQAGVMGELMFPGIGFGVDFGLEYSLHGAKFDLGSKPVWAVDGYGKENVYLHTLQIPLHLRFKYTNLNGVERTIAPFVFAGPRFSFRLADNGVKAFDYPGGAVQVQFGLGAELMERVQIYGCFNLGASYEVRTVKLENYSGQPRSWQVGVAYMF